MNKEPDREFVPPPERDRPAQNGQMPDEASRALATRPLHALEFTDTESLPVLAAFQAFLEGERRRSRRRIAILGVVFAAAMVVVIVAGISFGRSALQFARHGYLSVRTDFDAFRRQAKRESDQVDSHFDAIGREGRELRETLKKERQSLAETRSALKEETDGLRGELGHMQKVVHELQSENARLRRYLSDVEQTMPVLMNRVDEALRKIEMPAHAGPGSSPAPVAALVAAPVGPLVLSVKPRGAEQAITWRLPVPE